MTVELKGISRTYPGGFEAVAGVELAVADGELLTVVGPSGSGKSTLLRLIAGLEAPSTGEVRIDGRRADVLPPHARDVAMVFQNPALYPHLSVFENLAFGLRARGYPRAEIRARVEEAASLLGLADLLPRRPGTLSGGQRQRAALGRALARRPALFLFDEPFSNLDAPLRAAIRADLSDLHRRLGAAMIFVTHDQAEALALGDRVAVLIGGRLVQVGTPAEVYDRPETRAVAEFLGSPRISLLPSEIAAEGDRLLVRPRGIGPWALPRVPPLPHPSGASAVDLGLRAEHVAAGPFADAPGALAVDLVAEVLRLEPLGHETIATLRLGPHELTTRLAPHAPTRPGDRLPIRIDLGHALWFDPSTGAILRGTDRP